jgi:hypothetical protein
MVLRFEGSGEQSCVHTSFEDVEHILKQEDNMLVACYFNFREHNSQGVSTAETFKTLASRICFLPPSFTSRFMMFEDQISRLDLDLNSKSRSRRPIFSCHNERDQFERVLQGLDCKRTVVGHSKVGNYLVTCGFGFRTSPIPKIDKHSLPIHVFAYRVRSQFVLNSR